MIKKFVYWFADFIDNLWTTIFGTNRTKWLEFANQFRNIPHEWHDKDPKYPKVPGYYGRKTIFALKDKKGKLYDVPCLIVNDLFVVIDVKDGNKRKYITWQ